MAIDSAEKRRSAGGVPFLPLGVNVTPNASKDGEWRQQSAWSYSGIATDAAGSSEVIWCVVALDTYIPGSVVSQEYVPGAVVSQTK